MEFRSQRKLRHRKLKGRKFTFCDFTAFFAGDVLLWSAYIRIDDDELFEKGYHFSENQKNQISNAKSDNLTLVITDFKADIKAAEKFLIGEMHNQGISVDKKADRVFRELNRIISQKAEIIITKDAEKELKKITANELQPILMKVSALERFDVVLE